MILGLEPGASYEQIQEAYRDLIKVWHPDRFAHDPRLQQKAHEQLKKINEAYSQLKNYRPSPSESWQVEIERKYMSSWERICEFAAEELNVKFYKNLVDYSKILACFSILIGFGCIFIHKFELVIIFWGIYVIAEGGGLYLKKVASHKLRLLKELSFDAMEKDFGSNWHPYRDKCIYQLYKKYGHSSIDLGDIYKQ